MSMLALRTLSLCTIWIWAVSATGCGLSAAGPETLAETSPGDELTVQLGCDETFVARNPSATVVLAVRVPGLLDRVREAELPYREKLDVASPELDVRLEEGADLEHWCTDVMARPPRIDAVWLGVSGTVVVEVTERIPERSRAVRGIVRLESVVLARKDALESRRKLAELEIRATVGVPGGG